MAPNNAGNQPPKPNLADPNAATMAAGPPPMKDEDINRMLSEIGGAPAPANDPANAATMVQPVSGGMLPAAPLSPSNAGPEAQPFAPPAQQNLGAVPLNLFITVRPGNKEN